MKYRIIALSFLALITSCKSTSLEPELDEGLLIGEDSSDVKVMIRTIDQGQILWVGSYKLGTTAPISIGEHNVSIICEFTYPWGTKLVPGNLNIDVAPDTTYKIKGELSIDDKRCLVSIKG